MHAAPRIFISYRRKEESGIALQLYASLIGEFGNRSVFLDRERIVPGDDYRERIGRELDTCTHMLVLIDKGWRGEPNEHGPTRLHDPENYIRKEVGAALKRPVRVILVLLDGAPRPNAEELPKDMHPLLSLQTLDLLSQEFDEAVRGLVRVIRTPRSRAIGVDLTGVWRFELLFPSGNRSVFTVQLEHTGRKLKCSTHEEKSIVGQLNVESMRYNWEGTVVDRIITLQGRSADPKELGAHVVIGQLVGMGNRMECAVSRFCYKDERIRTSVVEWVRAR